VVVAAAAVVAAAGAATVAAAAVASAAVGAATAAVAIATDPPILRISFQSPRPNWVAGFLLVRPAGRTLRLDAGPAMSEASAHGLVAESGIGSIPAVFGPPMRSKIRSECRRYASVLRGR
jgi:hypothetical protein